MDAAFRIMFLGVGDPLRVVFVLYAAVRITLALWAEGVKSRPLSCAAYFSIMARRDLSVLADLGECLEHTSPVGGRR